MSYSTVNTKKIDKLDLKNSDNIKLNTSSVNIDKSKVKTDTYKYEEIDYSQDTKVLPTLLNVDDFENKYGDVCLNYEINNEIKIVPIKNSVYYLTCSKRDYDYFINSVAVKQSYTETIEQTAKYDALYNYIIDNKINLDDSMVDRLKQLSSVYNEAIIKKDTLEPTTLSYTDEVKNLINAFDKALLDLNKEIEPLQNEYDKAYNIISNPYTGNANNILDRNAEICNRIKPDLDALKAQKVMLESYIYQLEYELALAPYKEMTDTKDYQDFIKIYDSNYQNIDFILLSSVDYNISAYIAAKSSDKTIEQLIDSKINVIDKLAIVEHFVEENPNVSIDDLNIKYPNFINEFTNYQFMSQEQRDMYHYLFAKKGEKEANNYLNIISDSINQAHGAKEASEFIETLNLNDKGKLEKSLSNFFGVSKKGLGDGINTFCDGITNVLINNEKLTASDYEKMLVLQYLQENSNYFDEIYTFNSALGNMLPSITASAVVTLAATPAAGSVASSTLIENAGSITGSALMGLSAGGNAKHSALVQGNSVLTSSLYGVLIGLSETTLEYFLGGNPGVSKSTGLTISNLLKEGFEEYLQEWVDAGLQSVILGTDVKWEEIPKQSTDSFIMGVLMSGLLNGGQTIINLSINGIVHEINVQKVIKVLEDNPNMSPEQALRQVYPDIMADIPQNQNNTNRNIALRKLDYSKVELIVSKYNNDYRSAFADILFEVGKTKGYNDTRLICRDLITFLDSKGIDRENSTLIISQALTGAYRKRGFNSQIIDFAGNKIEVKEQTSMNYSLQPFKPAQVLNDISKLPIEFQVLVKDLTFYDTFSPNDFYREHQYGIKDFRAAASAGDGNINFFAGSRYDFRTIVHELAHCYDRRYSNQMGVNGRISESQLWLTAMKADEKISGITAVTEYARQSNTKEDFAEAVSFYYTDISKLDKFPNRKALLAQILPKNQNIKNNASIVNKNNINQNNVNIKNISKNVPSVYQSVMNILIKKYGTAEAKLRIEYYLQTGNLNYITSENGARALISNISLNELKNYHNSLVTKTSVPKTSSNVSDVYNNSFNYMVQRNGKDNAIRAMKAYLLSGNLEYLPTSNGIRQNLSSIKIEEVRAYIRSINNNSLDINNLYK